MRASHFMKLVFFLLAYGMGYLGLRKRAEGWMMQVWHIVYIVAVLLLVGLGVYDWEVARTPLVFRVIADNLLEFLISPLLYVGIGLLARSLDHRKG